MRLHELSPPDRWRYLLGKMHIATDGAERESLLALLHDNREKRVVSFVNAHGANLAWRDVDFFTNLASSDLLLRDGIGIKILMKRYGMQPGVNLNGTDLIPQILHQADKDGKLAIYGTTDQYLQIAGKKIKDAGFSHLTTLHGFHELSVYTTHAGEYGPDIVLLAMGMPKQEQVAMALREQLEKPVLIINGGAIIDFIAGRYPRAPQLLRYLGLEWAYRLSREPKRLWRRYITGNFLFLFRCLLVHRK